MNQTLINHLAETILRLSISLHVSVDRIQDGIRLAHTQANLSAVDKLHATVGMVAKGAKHKSTERVRLMDSLVYYFNGLSVLMLKALDDGATDTAVKRLCDINWVAGELEILWLAENVTKKKSKSDGGLNSKPAIKQQRIEAYHRYRATANSNEDAYRDAAHQLYRTDNQNLSDAEIATANHQEKIRKLADAIRKNVDEEKRQSK